MSFNRQDGARQLSLLVAAVSMILGIAIAGSGCKSRTPARHQRSERTYLQTKDSLGQLIANLVAMPGELVDHGVGPRSAPLFEAIATFGDSAVTRLVDCMSDTSSAAPSLEGRHVSVGIMCYEALAHVAYYESYEYEPEGPNKYRDWEGDIAPSATHDQLLKAQIAWRFVIREKRYRLL